MLFNLRFSPSSAIAHLLITGRTEATRLLASLDLDV